MLLEIKQWESKYIRDFQAVRNGEITEERLYTKLTAMYFDFVSNNELEPFTISYGRGSGFCINANFHVGVIIHEDIVLYITSMVPELSLGKILYLNAQAEETTNESTTKKVLAEQMNNEENISAVDYFVVSLINVIEDIKQNGILSEIATAKEENNRIVGRLDLARQIESHPAYDAFCIERTTASNNIVINRIIKAAIVKACEITSLEWAVPLLIDAENFFADVDVQEDIEAEDFPEVKDITTIPRNDYEQALRFAKFILLGYDPLAGDNASFFPEFMLNMNEVFEFYVTVGLKRIFRSGFENKKILSLGLGPIDIPITRKNIELDGYYERNNKRVVLDTKNKYKTVLDRDIPDFIAANPDIYQQYYYASRVNAKSIVLVYPSSKKHNAPIGEYSLSFPGNKEVKMYFWALHISGTPRENSKALIKLAEFIESIPE